MKIFFLPHRCVILHQDPIAAASVTADSKLSFILTEPFLTDKLSDIWFARLQAEQYLA